MAGVLEPKIWIVGNSRVTDATGKTGTNARFSSKLLVC